MVRRKAICPTRAEVVVTTRRRSRGGGLHGQAKQTYREGSGEGGGSKDLRQVPRGSENYRQRGSKKISKDNKQDQEMIRATRPRRWR